MNLLRTPIAFLVTLFLVTAGLEAKTGLSVQGAVTFALVDIERDVILASAPGPANPRYARTTPASTSPATPTTTTDPVLFVAGTSAVAFCMGLFCWRTLRITRRATSQRIKETERRFNNMVANVPGMVYQFTLTSDGRPRFEYVSVGVTGIYGLRPEQIVANPLILLHDRVHPDDRAGLTKSIQQSSQKLSPWSWTGRMFHANGETRWVRGISRPQRLPDGGTLWDGILTDVTEAQAASIELERARAEARKLALVAANTGNAAIITDATGHVEWVNESFTRITEFTLEEVVGRKPGHFLQGSETDPATVSMIRQSVSTGEACHGEIINYSKSQRKYWIAFEIVPVRDENGQLTHFIAIENDITAAKEAEQNLYEARDAADAANRAKSEFLANMSHEIRTPLGAVLGFSSMLLTDELSSDDERRDWVLSIQSSARHLLRLINDVLDISKIEAGKMDFESIEFNPTEIVAEVVTTMRTLAAEKGLELSLDFDTKVPQCIHSDPTRFKQVLLNLTSNAIKFTPSGRVRLVCSFDGGDLPTLSVRVIDSGIGMSDQQLSRIFAPFVQADSSVTRRFGGTGLGLAISRFICQQLGGDIQVASEPGVGSTFCARFACGSMESVLMIDGTTVGSTDESCQSDHPPVAPIKLNRVRVLVADDGLTNRKLVTLILTRAGATVTSVENGRRAIEAVAEGDYDIILMDMQMPEVDGYTATARLREAGCRLPIIALTAHAMKGDRDRCLVAGCDDYLTKPIEAALLLQGIARCVQIKPEPAEVASEISSGSFEAPAKVQSPASATPVDGSHGVTGGRDALEPLFTELPRDDEEFVDIARSFVESAKDRLEQMKAAARDRDYAALKNLAHWLKGSGGSAGYPAFSSEAARLEELVADQMLDEIRSNLSAIEQLVARSATAFVPNDPTTTGTQS